MTSKRKAPDENPLLNPPKRNKHDKDKGKSKRTIPNGEQQPSGLVIVRAPSAPPMNSQSSSRPPTSTSRANPPTKQPRPASQPPASQPKASTSKVTQSKPSLSQPVLSRSRDILSSPGDALAIENDVRAMDDESDEYRRQSRARSTIHPSLFSNAQPSSPRQNTSWRAMSVDITQPLPTSESPAIQRNKALRQGAMDAIRQSREEDEVSQTPSGHRRRSSVGGRGNRIRVSIESTGTISQPHNSVAESSFHKHIPPELPDADRMRLLLSWCSTRANNIPPPQDEKNPFPTLTPKATALLHSVEDSMIRMLSDKQVDTRTSVPREHDVLPQRQNEQNESNRRFEITYTEQIRSMEREDEEWKNARRFYDAYFKKRQTDAVHPPSAKAKGKQRETETGDDDEWTPRHLSTAHHTALALAKSAMKPREDRDIQPGLQDLEFNVDMLNSHLNRARTLTAVAEEMLNARFANLAVEANLAPAPAPGSLLISGGAHDADPLDVLRALARTDRGRPPAKVGDAARRAKREIQRVEEKGIGAVGERRLTGVPPTPRTPRRGSTPGRDKA